MHPINHTFDTIKQYELKGTVPVTSLRDITFKNKYEKINKQLSILKPHI